MLAKMAAVGAGVMLLVAGRDSAVGSPTSGSDLTTYAQIEEWLPTSDVQIRDRSHASRVISFQVGRVCEGLSTWYQVQFRWRTDANDSWHDGAIWPLSDVRSCAYFLSVCDQTPLPESSPVTRARYDFGAIGKPAWLSRSRTANSWRLRDEGLDADVGGDELRAAFAAALADVDRLKSVPRMRR